MYLYLDVHGVHDFIQKHKQLIISNIPITYTSLIHLSETCPNFLATKGHLLLGP